MLNKKLILGVSLLILIILFGAFPLVTYGQQDATNANFIFINYFGQELFLDLDDTQYVVPGTATVPAGGRLELQLAPGEHKYAANVPGVGAGSAGEFTIEPGQVVAKAARLEVGAPLVENGIIIEKGQEQVRLFDFDPFAPPVTATPAVTTWQPTAPPQGQGSLVWVNFYGGNELTVDLNGMLYKVPPQSNNSPGRLQINLPPNLYRYTVSVPNGSFNGEITVVPGQVTGLNVFAEVQATPTPEPGDEFQAIPPVTLRLATEDLTGQVTSASPPAASTSVASPPATTVPSPASPQAPTGATGLLVKNYSGDALIFTVNDQAYQIAENTEQTLPLPPGQYNYTASIPAAAINGTVNLAAGQTAELSIVINLAGDVLTVYQTGGSSNQ